MKPTQDLTVSCSCGSATHTFTVSTSCLPLPSHLCNCDTSRRISGSLLTSYINVSHGSSSPKPDLSNLTPYHSSEKLTRHFCSTCGTHMYLEYHDDGHFEAATGTLQVDSMEGVVEYKSCMWIGDTSDGGASDWIASIGGKRLKRWSQEAEESEEVPAGYYSAKKKQSGSNKPVHAHCHCRGVEFWITPPNDASKTARSDFPDLMIPYHHGTEASANPDNVSWWLRKDDTRYMAGTCTCRSCRRASGFDITFWAFIPTANIFIDIGLTQPFTRYTSRHENEYWGAMKNYSSSEGVTRTFCGKCGANVFWDGGPEKGRDGLIDVAIGLLDAKSGARAEELLEWWTERVSFEEFAVNRHLVAALAEGLRDWRIRTDDRSAVKP